MEQENSDGVQPMSLIEALNLKYSLENCMVDNFAHIQLSSRSKEKTKDLALLPHVRREVVTLDCCGISVAGNLGEISRVCPRVSELDLTGNLIKNWNDVFVIVSQLQNLRFLNLCGNPLDESTFPPNLKSNVFQSERFASVAKLVLNNTKVSLCTVQHSLRSFPSLEELHLSLNDYSSIPTYDEPCTSVKQLHFNSNNIQHWKEVEKLGKMFPNLETLIIMENPLTNLERNMKDESFLSLKFLSLTKSNLASWKDIEALRDFVKLNRVKLIGIPLLKSYENEEARRLLVARLPNIEFLNGTPIKTTERENAERHFIRRFQMSEDPPSRYHELVNIHGELDPLAEVSMDPAHYAEVLIHVTGKPSRLQSIYLEQTTDNFRKTMAATLKVPSNKISLHYKDTTSNQGCERMIFKDRRLYRYRMKDGDEIFVDILN